MFESDRFRRAIYSKRIGEGEFFVATLLVKESRVWESD